MQIALFQPDDPGNVGAVLRLGACLAVPVMVVEPCGFVWDRRRLRRVGLDYLERVRVTRLPSWSSPSISGATFPTARWRIWNSSALAFSPTVPPEP